MDQIQLFLEQLGPYQQWLIIAGAFGLFILLRLTRQALRRRVDTIGYRLLRERGLLIWFWLNAPGVILHELSHATAILLFTPFGFRITRITLFRIKPEPQYAPRGVVRRHQSLQLGEVQYIRPQGKFMSYVGDGLSGIAPLFGGIGAFIFLYWVATGFNLWDLNIDNLHQQFQILRPGWPLWTLIFAPYLILTVTSELWPSRQDWLGARWFVCGLVVLALLALALLWYSNELTGFLIVATSIASHVDFALLILLALDTVFILVTEGLVRLFYS